MINHIISFYFVHPTLMFCILYLRTKTRNQLIFAFKEDADRSIQRILILCIKTLRMAWIYGMPLSLMIYSEHVQQLLQSCS